MEQVANQEPMIRRAMTIEETFMKNESERYLYELREKGRRDYESAMLTAEKRGREEGIKRMLEEKRETARTMLADGMAPELVAKYTRQTVEEIEVLRHCREEPASRESRR